MRNKHVSPFVQEVLRKRRDEAIEAIERKVKREVDEARSEALDDPHVAAVLAARNELERAEKAASKAGFTFGLYKPHEVVVRKVEEKLRAAANGVVARVRREFEATMLAMIGGEDIAQAIKDFEKRLSTIVKE